MGHVGENVHLPRASATIVFAAPFMIDKTLEYTLRASLLVYPLWIKSGDGISQSEFTIPPNEVLCYFSKMFG